ncbi:MAG: hypothetical protein U0174_11430 [Polyangiaceae bacterium]
MSPRVSRLAPWGLLLVVLLGAALAPPYVKDTLLRPCAWGLLILAAFGGYGGLIAKLAGGARADGGTSELDFGLKSALGAAGLVVFGGVLSLLSLAKGPVLFGLVMIGVALHGMHLARAKTRALISPRALYRLVRRFPARVFALAIVLALIVITYAGGAADTSLNPYDDDVAYSPFVKQLVQAGTLLDPFSFRRMSTLGGQPFFHALVACRLDIVNVNLFERGICAVMIVWLFAGFGTPRAESSTHSRAVREKPPWTFVTIGAVFFLLLKTTTINSASYYSGAALFLALYRSAEFVVPGPPKQLLRSAIPLVLIGAAACTLRQNYLVTVVVFQGLVLTRAFGVRVGERRSLFLTVGASFALLVAFILPWSLLLYRSNGTLLWPLMRGTFTQGAAITNASITPSQQLQHLIGIFFTPEPIRTLPVLAFAALFAPAIRGRMHTGAYAWIAGLLGVVALSVSFSLSDTANLGRYYYGFMTAAVLFSWRTMGIALRKKAPLSRLHLAAAGYFFCLAWQLVNVDDRIPKPRDLHVKLRDIDEQWNRTIPSEGSKAVDKTYAALQSHVPPGERILVLVDEPYGFDFSRNPILNLDLPGLSGLAPGFVSFRGPDALADYFTKNGFRYLALVLPESSVYLYRKEIWFENVYHPEDIWRVYAPYVLDGIENLELVAKSHRELYRGDGMVLVDLTLR